MTGDVPIIVIPYRLFTTYPASWTVCALDTLYPYKDKIGVVLEALDHRGRLMEVLHFKPGLLWHLITEWPAKEPGLYLKVNNLTTTRKVLATVSQEKAVGTHLAGY